MNSDRISQLYCSIAFLAIIAWLFAGSIDSTAAIITMVIAITVIGLPHGALDFAIAQLIGLCTSPSRVLAFLVGYLFVVGLSIGFWIIVPAAALMIFLIVSAHHFASDWQDALSYWPRLSLSTITLCAPSLLYASVLSDIFRLLFLSPKAAQTIILIMQAATVISGGFLIRALVFRRSLFQILSRWQIGELMFLLISSLLVTPLLHFTLYFCLLHSIKHFSHTAKSLGVSLGRATWLSIPFVLLTVTGVLFIAWLRPSQLLSPALLQYVFIGLFGLTIAHMLLTERWRLVSSDH
ncbi:Brp/Blh family beta-carotene 15,15'-dioxygenase [Aliiglaciecola sp.]|nr:Brp/Blh family beta-carotene 15,15'-dioxygenase [Aliiglaciecola sp.]